MSTDADPIAGSWYEHLQNGRTFEVVDVDDENGLVEIQYFDGDVDEIELDAWYELDLEPIEPPEDWSGPLDSIEPDDRGYSEAEPEDLWRSRHGSVEVRETAEGLAGKPQEEKVEEGEEEPVDEERRNREEK